MIPDMYSQPIDERLFSIVKKHIDEADPAGLLCFAPEDEYDSESAEISLRMSADMNAVQLSELIAEIFSRTFHPAMTFSAEQFLHYAENILHDIAKGE